MSRVGFQKLYRQPVQDWRREAIDDLTTEELAAICQLLGISYSGTKSARRARIWSARHLRLILAPYQEGPGRGVQSTVEALAANYRADEMLALCRAADCYAGPTKYGRAAALLQWRNACRQRGQEALAQARAAAAGMPRQSKLRWEDLMDVPMRRVTAWFDGFELEAEEIAATVASGEVLYGEARYSTRNRMNADSLDVMAELVAAPYRWPLVEMPMDDDSLNCIALVVRLSPEALVLFRGEIAELELTDSAGIWDDREDDPALEISIGGVSWSPAPPSPTP